MKRLNKAIVAGATVAFLVFPMAASASASATDPSDSSARLISRLAPDAGPVLRGATVKSVRGAQGSPQSARGKSTTSATVRADIDRDGAADVSSVVSVEVPDNSSLPVTVDSDSTPFPLEVTVDSGSFGPASRAADGTIVYRGDGQERAVQTFADGSVRMLSIAQEPAASHEYTYSFNDELDPVLNDDGSVDLVQTIPGTGVTVAWGHIDAPWAVDNNGAPVATSYSIVGGELVQQVLPTPETEYPVVADPKFTYNGIIASIYFNKAETRAATGGTTAVVAIANKIPNAVVSGALVVGAAAMAGTSAVAWQLGKCSAIKIVWAGPFFTWSPWVHSGSYCK